MDEKPRVIISRCIEIAPCRWNAQMIGSKEVRAMKDYLNFQPVCPEEEIGLGIPRKSVRVVLGETGNRLVQSETDLDVTDDMNQFSSAFLSSAGEVDGFILKAASPSCGPGDVKLYRSTRKERHISSKENGLFAQAVSDRYPDTIIETEGRLTNFLIREHFLTRIFNAASFRAVSSSDSMKELIRFHSQNKYLFMSYNQSAMRECGRIVANHDHLPFKDLVAQYYTVLKRMFNKISRTGSNINVLMHSLGYFSKDLSSAEKAFFLDMLEDYRVGRVPLSTCTSIMRTWIIRFDTTYLKEQTFFEPFPKDLIHLTDSGQGRPVEPLR